MQIMNMQFDFTAIMANNSDRELLKIVTVDRDNYQPAAIEAAELELKKRNLSSEFIEQANKHNEAEKQLIEAKANEPLEAVFKGLAFIFPGILMLLFSAGYKASGYDRKSNELATWTFYGLGLYMTIIIVMILSPK